MKAKAMGTRALGVVFFAMSALAVVFHPQSAGGQGQSPRGDGLARVCLEVLYLELEKPAWDSPSDGGESFGEKSLYCRSPLFPPVSGEHLVSAVTVDGGAFLGLYEGKRGRRGEILRKGLVAAGWRETEGSALANERTKGAGVSVFVSPRARMLVFDVGKYEEERDLLLVVGMEEGRER